MSPSSAEPSPAEPRSLADEQRDVARARVLRAVRVVLAERGVDSRIEDIAEAAGVSRRTIFRYFANREELMAAATVDGLRSYVEHVPWPVDGELIDEWLPRVSVALHRMNAQTGRAYWDLSARREADGPWAEAAIARRDSWRALVHRLSTTAWELAGGSGEPPTSLVDVIATELTAPSTETLVQDLGRSIEEAGLRSAHVIGLVLYDALSVGVGGSRSHR